MLENAFGVPDRSIRNMRNNPNCHDGRSEPKQKNPNAITEEEKENVLNLLNDPRVADLSIRAAYYYIQDRTDLSFGVSLSSVYLIVRDHGFKRRDGVKPARSTEVTHKSVTVTGINQIWTLDYTSVDSSAADNRMFHYLNVMDLFSRKMLNDLASATQSADDLCSIVERLFIEYGITPATKLTIHCDNGSAMKSKKFQRLCKRYGVTISHSRPHVSDDNAFSEVGNRTIKYAQRLKFKKDATIEEFEARLKKAVAKYNDTAHSSLNNISPNAKHSGADELQQLDRRKLKMDAAKAANPGRWNHHKTASYDAVASTTMYYGQISSKQPALE